MKRREERRGPAPPLEEVARVLAEAAGVSLSDGLDLALDDALLRAASSLGLAPGELARRVVARDPDAVATLVEHAVVGETAFWRHPEQLAAIGRLAAARPGPLRLWSAGCATGEEPFSVAFALLEAGRRADRVIATDVSERALAAARAATYAPRALRKLPPELARWLEPGHGTRRVGAEARALVTFERHNLVSQPVPGGGRFDVVLCRNVLIYFSPETATAVLRRLIDAVTPGGILVLGPVELPLAGALDVEWIEDGGATLLRRPERG